MASNKEQSTSPQNSPKREQKRSSDQGVNDPAHESFLEAAKQQSRTKLPKDVKDLTVKFADLFKEGLAVEKETVETAIPYYSDLHANKYAILSEKDLAKDEDPFNKAITAFIGESDEGTVFRFEDTGLKKEAIPLLDDLSIYIHKLKKAAFDYKVENGQNSRSALFRQVNNYIADLYWEFRENLKSPLIPKDLLQKYLDKKVQVKKSNVYDHRKLLFGILVQFNNGEHKDRMANAYCHLIRESVKIGIDTNYKFYRDNLISREKRFTPSMTMLGIKGYIPDVKIKKYKSLFLSSENENIRDSKLELGETRLQELHKEQLTVENLPRVLRKLREIRSTTDDDLLSVEIKKVRKERLLIASRLKDAHKTRSAFKLSTAVSNSLQDPKVRDAFNPFRLAFAEGNIETAPGQAITCITFNEDTGFYQYIQNEYNDKLDNGKVKAIALEFVAFLEG
jgi:hypothetical protein